MNMRICLTNDDGYEASGLSVLARVAMAFGATDIVAPATPQSQMGHAVTLNHPLPVHRRQQDGLGPVVVVAGTPAECVRVALVGTDNPRPDWVLSGINHGANLGVDVYYSGTVAAAREAAIHGVPAIALSQFIRRPNPVNWEGAAIMVRRVLDRLLPHQCPRGTYWTVTLPSVEGDFDAVPLVEAPLSTDPLPLAYEKVGPVEDGSDVPSQGVHLRYAGRYTDREIEPGTDVAVAFSGRIAITRLSLSGTASI